MTPVSSPLSFLLKRSDSLQRASAVCLALRGLPRRTVRSPGWKRNFGAVSHGVGELLSHQPTAKNYAASVCSGSPGGQDMTERLWSVYNETKRQTKGRSPHNAAKGSSVKTHAPLRLIQSINNHVMTHVSNRLIYRPLPP